MLNNVILILGALQKIQNNGRKPQLLPTVEEKKMMEVSKRWW